MRIPIHVARGAQAVGDAGALRVGVPLPKGALRSCDEWVAVDRQGRPLACQGRALCSWSDGSIRWMLADVALPGDGADVSTLHLVDRPAVADRAPHPFAPLSTHQTTRGIVVRTGEAEFELHTRADSLLAAVRIDGVDLLGEAGARLVVRGRDGLSRPGRVCRLAIEHVGPVRADIVADGRFGGLPECPLEFRARLSFVAGARSVGCELRIRNPRAAQHPGGLWDLGDAGSWEIADLSLDVPVAVAAEWLEWSAEASAAPSRGGSEPWCLYQDSSGGERWNSPNHVDGDGRPTVSFRGYEVRVGGPQQPRVAARGLRAQPLLAAGGAQGWVAGTIEAFWENFPKALRWEDGALSFGLFPRECPSPAELQGGEQKRHWLQIEFGAMRHACPRPAARDETRAWVDPAWVEASHAVHGLVVDLTEARANEEYVERIVDAQDGFVARRESIDEYGWRNFGELHADHEAVNHRAAEPFVSHYNNQYDFVWGAGVHALRTGDLRWWRLMRDSARHTADIDVYHTLEDRPAFNGGLFWHTDHYLPARTATHRTYSRRNASGAAYGGGPGNEHDYASGLMLHHFATGDEDSREAVIGLAEWVVAMDDGGRTLLGVLDAGPTGTASATLEPDYHGPGRGAGNSIGTLLDAYALTRRRGYLEKAEELIRRCIHPADDIAARRLDDPEHRWSYLVFLQVLGKYLDAKRELGEFDFAFHYARESLMHYADWMLEHEVPYGDILHKVELPTETWPAHDIRKCHVLHVAACYDDRGQAGRYADRAAWFYERCLGDLSGFATRYLTRPLVILSVYGHLHAYYRRLRCGSEPQGADYRHAHDFGAPQAFVPQRGRAVAAFRGRLAIALREVRRIATDRLARGRGPGRAAK